MKAPRFEKQQHSENTVQVCQQGRVCFVCRKQLSKRQRHTVASAFRHTLHLLNIWPGELWEVDQPAALSGPENIDRQQKEKEGLEIVRTICSLINSSPS